MVTWELPLAEAMVTHSGLTEHTLVTSLVLQTQPVPLTMLLSKHLPAALIRSVQVELASAMVEDLLVLPIQIAELTA